MKRIHLDNPSAIYLGGEIQIDGTLLLGRGGAVYPSYRYRIATGHIMSYMRHKGITVNINGLTRNGLDAHLKYIIGLMVDEMYETTDIEEHERIFCEFSKIRLAYGAIGITSIGTLRFLNRFYTLIDLKESSHFNGSFLIDDFFLIGKNKVANIMHYHNKAENDGRVYRLGKFIITKDNIRYDMGDNEFEHVSISTLNYKLKQES